MLCGNIRLFCGNIRLFCVEALKLVLISGVMAHSLGCMVWGVGFGDRCIHCLKQKQGLISNSRVYVAEFLWSGFGV